MKHRISKAYYKNIVAAFVILCMIVTDSHMFRVLLKDTVITEEHEMDIAMADGKYEGDDSDSPNTESNSVIIREADGKSMFNILEIVPTEKKAVVGFTIGGCEPFDNAKGLKRGDEILVTPQDMRAAYMDAFINPTPGSSNAKSWDYINTNIGMINSKMAECNTGHWDAGLNMWVPDALMPFVFTPVDANGYYKYVGAEYGVFAKGEIENGDQKMYSKFYNYDPAKRYEYIYVDTGDPVDPKDINVTNHKRIKYTNNEKFIRDVFGKRSLEEALAWKETHEVSVTARTPMSVTLADIERADVIFVNNGSNMDYYKCAVEMNNISHGVGNKEDGKYVVFDNTIDFKDFEEPEGVFHYGFEKVIRIYERVVVREDVAFIGSRNCINGTTFDTNMHKLMCMLYFVNNNNIKDEYGNVCPGGGRDLFMDFMKRYVSNPGVEYMRLRQAHEADPSNKLKPDYRAPSLRNSPTNYMHYHLSFHPGHPFVLHPEQAITGGHYDESGNLVEEHNNSNIVTVNARGDGSCVDCAHNARGTVFKRTMKRSSADMFTKAGISEKEKNSKGKYKSDSYGWYYSKDTDPNARDGNRRDYCFDAYESMSNTTDYIYIDDSGKLVRDTKYSGYWFNMDEDDGQGWRAFKKIAWDPATYDTWPWNVVDSGCLKEWFFHKDTTKDNYNTDGSVKGNLHLWFDYFSWGPYRAVDGVNGDTGYKNQSLEAENSLFKQNSALIRNAVQGRTVERETDDPGHTTVSNVSKDYSISMNILNGDGVNLKPTATNKNKVLYFNQYEHQRIVDTENSTHKAYIPIKIRIMSSCKLDSINVYRDNKASTPIATYNFHQCDVGTSTIECTGSGGREIELMPNNPDPLPTTEGEGTPEPIYTYDALIYDTMSNLYIDRRNTKFIVELNAVAPDDTIKSIVDEFTFVQRDYFMLQ